MTDGPASKNPYPWWKAKIWHGMSLVNWLRLLARYRFDITLSQAYRSIIATIVATFNQVSAAAQWLIFAGRVEAVKLPPPVFIIGHWRTGTTFLHELLAADPRFLTPTAMQCLCPDHFLASHRIVAALEFMLPKRRPMDDFEVHWDAPQEDEFALLAMGVRSPYELFAFPRDYEKAFEALDIEQLKPRQRLAWRRAFIRFLKSVTLARRRGADQRGDPDGVEFLLLKSPTHTARLRLLAEMFPDARFVHLTRDRQGLFASTKALWRAMISTQSLYRPPPTASDGRDLIEAVTLDGFDRLYANFHRDRSAIAAERIIDVRFSDLTLDPRATVERIYGFLGVDLDTAASERLDRRIAAFRAYEPSRHDLPAADRDLAERHFAEYPQAFEHPGGVAPAGMRGAV